MFVIWVFFYAAKCRKAGRSDHWAGETEGERGRGRGSDGAFDSSAPTEFDYNGLGVTISPLIHADEQPISFTACRVKGKPPLMMRRTEEREIETERKRKKERRGTKAVEVRQKSRELVVGCLCTEPRSLQPSGFNECLRPLMECRV